MSQLHGSAVALVSLFGSMASTFCHGCKTIVHGSKMERLLEPNKKPTVGYANEIIKASHSKESQQPKGHQLMVLSCFLIEECYPIEFVLQPHLVGSIQVPDLICTQAPTFLRKSALVDEAKSCGCCFLCHNMHFTKQFNNCKGSLCPYTFLRAVVSVMVYLWVYNGLCFPETIPRGIAPNVGS